MHEATLEPAPEPQSSSRLRTLVVFAMTFGLGVGVGAIFLRRAPTSSTPTRAAPTVAGSASARTVRMPAVLRERAGVRTSPARARTLSPTLELVGSVEFHGDRVADVGSRVAGRVARVLVQPGATVRAGQALVEIESAAVGEAAAAHASAHAAATVARAELARLTELARLSLATARDVEQTRGRVTTSEAEMRSATQRMLAMGVPAGDLAALTRSPRLYRLTLRSPIDGRVVERPAVLGQVVEPTAMLLRVADPRTLWVQLAVFDLDLPRVRVGDAAEVTAEAYPGRLFPGTVSLVAGTVDRETRTARVRIEIDNADELLRPGQFVNARLRSGAQGREALTIPRTAVVQLEGRPAGFVAVGESEFELRMLELGATDGAEVEVLHGLARGDAVVVAGAFALKSELLR